MCDFNALDDEAKQAWHERLLACADSIGGKNCFLSLLEAIREARPHPLIAKNSEFRFERGGIRWNKVIFEDKLLLLQKVRVGEQERGNLLPEPGDKAFKKVMNLVRTLRPVEFTVRPKNSNEGEGFTFSPINVVDETTTRLDPLFDAVFFCAVHSVKKALNYEPKEA